MLQLYLTLLLCLSIGISGMQVNVYVCENQKKSISCPDPRTSIEITSAAFGRTSTDICSNTPLPTSNINCVPGPNANHLGIVKNICDGKTSCELEAKNSVFGDTCGGTYKYLEVAFRCISDSTNVCEGDKTIISCSEPRSPIEITYAAYGRTSTAICNNTTLPHSNINCVPGPNADHLGIVKNKCDGKAYCELESKNSVFGDTCQGTYKYLEVDFKCKSDSTHVCEGGKKTISCSEPRTSIEITYANYGRTSTDICTDTPHPTSKTDCVPGPNADHLGIVKNKCDGKTSCELEAKNSVFGDTCGGTYKYLEVDFKCKSDSTNVCEGDKTTISCSEPRTSIEITYANYGRTSTDICTDTPHPTSKTDCVPGPNADHLGIVKNKCDGKTSCELEAKNSVFGDTCQGTYKYLEVDFKCKSDSTYVCEGGKTTISCSEPRTSIEITYANYGRTSTDICTDTPHPTSRTDCGPNANHLGIVKNKCDGKTSCELEAKNSVFGDTCPGTYKYLEVDFKCKSDSTNVCEGDKTTISCSEPSTSIEIKYAAYGRTSTDICNNTTLPHSKTDCVPGPNADHLGIVKNKCDGKTSCELEAKNSVFGDTCQGTYKYLEVDFECKENKACDTNPCLNEGSCSECVGVGCDDGYSCSCPQGFVGKNCEIELVNLALNKNTDQTGLKKEKQKFRSGQAVDGNVMTCAKTNKTLNPSWWVDLDGGAVVREVTLKRLGPGNRLLGVNVTVYVGDCETDLSQVCDTYVGPSVDSHTFYCPEDTVGDFVIVRRSTEFMGRWNNKERLRRLRICEAEVWGYYLNSNIALM